METARTMADTKARAETGMAGAEEAPVEGHRVIDVVQTDLESDTVTHNRRNTRLTVEGLAADCVDVRDLHRAGALNGSWVTFPWAGIRWPAIRKITPCATMDQTAYLLISILARNGVNS